jgi:hypothetical protein
MPGILSQSTVDRMPFTIQDLIEGKARLVTAEAVAEKVLV